MPPRVKGGQGMNPLYIILGIIVFIIIAYYVYSVWFGNVNNLASTQMNLNTTTPFTPIAVSTLTNPTSTRYTYGIWIYVNSWDTTKVKTIFSRGSDIALYLDANAAVLSCVINPTAPTTDALIVDPTASGVGGTNINITNNFPIQKWVFVTIVIDNQIADFYLDGKMVKSLNIPQVAPNSTSNIYYGNGFDAVINMFQRWAYPMDPQTVYNTYVSGMKSVSSNLTGGYHATVTITQNNNPTSTYKIF